ncbi:terpene synthase family protein [Streptomyces sp. NPDC055107]
MNGNQITSPRAPLTVPENWYAGEPAISFPLGLDSSHDATADLTPIDIDSPRSTAGHKIQRQQGVPLILFPQAAEMSPHYVMARPRVHEWFISKRILSGQHLVRNLAADYTLFTAMLHSPCTPDRLERLARYYVVWFAMDAHAETLWDEPSPSSRWFNAVLEYLDTGTTDRSDTWTAAFVEALEGLRLTPQLRRSYTYWKKDWIDAELRVARYGNTPHPDFLEDRHHTLGLMLALNVFTPYSLGLDLPASFVGHPMVQNYLWALTRLSSWQSDLLSLEVEDARGEQVNTVNVVAGLHGLTRQESIAEIHRRYRADVTEAQRLYGQALSAPWNLPPHITQTYLNAVRATAAGYLCWSQLSDRFRPQLFHDPAPRAAAQEHPPLTAAAHALRGPHGLGTSAAHLTLPQQRH